MCKEDDTLYNTVEYKSWSILVLILYKTILITIYNYVIKVFSQVP